MTQTSDERRTSHERASGAGNPGRLRFWLLLSMLLNVFLIGGIGGGAWRWWSESAHGDLVRSVTGANPASPRGLRVAADGLTPAQRQAFRSGLRNVRRASAELAQSSREGRAEVARLLASPRFDRSAIDAALARTRASDLELRQSIEAFVVNFAVDLSPADREILVQGLTAQQVRFMFRRRQPAVNSCAIACPVEHRSVQMNPSAIALNRFGLGARPGDAVPANPRSWLLDQFERYQPQPAAWLGQQSTEPLLDAFQVQQREMRNVSNEDRKAARQSLRRGAREDYLLTVNARLSSALDTPSPFVERLVHFWSNHFAISVEKPAVLTLAGAYEVDAIRPHVLGRFDELLLAAVRHPAMLVYLDQAQSVGPASIAAQRAADRKPQRKRGLNENLAREVLELHTLGARSGYTQADVTEFARALTGWSLAGVAGDMRELADGVTPKRSHAASSFGQHCTSRARAAYWGVATPRAERLRPWRSSAMSL